MSIGFNPAHSTQTIIEPIIETGWVCLFHDISYDAVVGINDNHHCPAAPQSLLDEFLVPSPTDDPPPIGGGQLPTDNKGDAADIDPEIFHVHDDECYSARPR